MPFTSLLPLKPSSRRRARLLLIVWECCRCSFILSIQVDRIESNAFEWVRNAESGRKHWFVVTMVFSCHCQGLFNLDNIFVRIPRFHMYTPTHTHSHTHIHTHTYTLSFICTFDWRRISIAFRIVRVQCFCIQMAKKWTWLLLGGSDFSINDLSPV